MKGFELLGIYINPIEKPEQWWPITGFLLATYFLKHSIDFFYGRKTTGVQMSRQAQLLLRNAYLKVFFLSILVEIYAFACTIFF